MFLISTWRKASLHARNIQKYELTPDIKNHSTKPSAKIIQKYKEMQVKACRLSLEWKLISENFKTETSMEEQLRLK